MLLRLTVMASIALLAVGCVRVVRVTPTAQPTKSLRAGECYEFDLPIYWAGGGVTVSRATACNTPAAAPGGTAAAGVDKQ